MSDLRDEEKIVLSQEEEQNSTLFGASPVKQQQDKPTNPKRKWIVAVSMVLICALLAGTAVLLTQLVPTTDSDSTSSEAKIFVTSVKNADVETVTLTRPDFTTVYRATSTQSDSSTTSSQGDPIVTWTIDGIDQSLTASSAISLVMDSVIAMPAIRKIDAVDGEDFGFGKPFITAEIKTVGGAGDVTVLIGSQSPSQSGYYATNDGGTTVYLIESDYVADMQKRDEEMAISIALAAPESDGSSYFTDGSLSGFDSITLSGTKYPQAMTFVPNTEDTISTYAPYRMTQPVRRFADDTAVGALFNIAKSGFNASCAYVYNPTAAQIKDYGLSQPESVLTVKYGTTTVKVSATLHEDGFYAVMVGENDKIIFKVSTGSLSYVDTKIESYFSSFVFMEMLSAANRITFRRRDGTTNVFDISYDEEANSFTVTTDGNTVSETNFQNYYQYLVGIEQQESTIEKFSGPAALTVTVEHTNGAAATTLKFAQFSDRRYYLEVGGEPIGYISTTYFNKLMKHLDAMLAGKTIPAAS